MTPRSLALLARLRAGFKPAEKISLAEWAEAGNIRIPPTQSAVPGRYHNWPYFIEPLDSIGDPDLPRVTIVKAARVGFALALDTPIPTPDGWMAMGDLRVGDSVFSDDGSPTTVRFVSPVFTDHDCYRIEFDDGSTIVADAGHRWAVDSSTAETRLGDSRRIGRPFGSRGNRKGEGARRGKSRLPYSYVATTEEMSAALAENWRTQFAIRNTAPLSLPDAELPVPPYLLGAWLGDGWSVTPRLTQSASDAEDMAECLRWDGVTVEIRADDARYPNNRSLVLDSDERGWSRLARPMRELGLISPGGRKHIPAAYLRASANQRLALLQGLMDTDGHIQTSGRKQGGRVCEFTNTNEALARGVYELAASLGYKPTISVRAPVGRTVWNSGHVCHGRLSQFRVRFRPRPEMNPFRLARKAGRVAASTRPSIGERRVIRSIERVSTVPVRCIEVEAASHLFLAGEQMVPTHNTKGICVAIGATAAVDPCAMILLVPRDSDVEDYSEEEIDPLFAESPGLRGLLGGVKRDGRKMRNTSTRKTMVGGASLKILSAMSPANLRRHDAKKLFCDEVDAYSITKEGDALKLAFRRTMAHADRKIVVGSTPTVEGVSVIAQNYRESDQRVYMTPCPHCGEFFEIKWASIRWPVGEPEKAFCACPNYASDGGGCPPIVEREHKLWMIQNGKWVPQRPEVKDHHGYKISALISLLPNASWAILAGEFLEAKRAGPADMQTFVNTVLAETWKTSVGITDASLLAERVESFGLAPLPNGVPRIPSDVVMTTVGADTQDERIEATHLGWTLDGRIYCLGHHVVEGSTLEDETWEAFDEFLLQKWSHPNGWSLGSDVVAIDSGGRDGRYQKVMDFCRLRTHRRIFAIKGDDGPRPLVKRAARVKGGGILLIIGKDEARMQVMERLARAPYDDQGLPDPHALRLSEDLPFEWFEQATNLVRQTRYVRNRTVVEFEPKRRGLRIEALDCLGYGYAIRYSAAAKTINLAERAARRAVVTVDHVGRVIPKTVRPPPPRSVSALSAMLNKDRRATT